MSQARETWDRRGRTHKLILRPRPIDTITDGRLTKRTQRAGRINLTSLSRIVPSSFLDINGDTARLNPTPPADAACLYTGRGKMSVTGVTMTSVDGHGQPLAANAQGRPYIAVSSGGRFDATDATLGDRGVQPSGTDKGEPAMSYNISYNTDATGTLLRTSLVRNTTGAELSRSRNVRLDAVTVVEPWSDGLLLQGDRRTVMKAITAERNGGNGVMVTGETSDGPVTNITTKGNHSCGVAVASQTKPQVLAVNTTTDPAGGLRLDRSTDAVVRDFTATDQPIGMFTQVHATNVVLQNVHIRGGRRGGRGREDHQGPAPDELHRRLPHGSRASGSAATTSILRT